MRAADWLLLAVLSVLWGGSFFFVAVAAPQIPPLTLVLARTALAAALLLPVLWWRGLALPPLRAAAWRPFVMLALLNNVVPFTLIVIGQTRIASALASVLNAATPLFTLIVARVFAGEALTPARLAGVVIGIAGVAVLMGADVLSADAASLIGMLCVLGGTVSYAFATLWMRDFKHTAPLVTATAQLACSAAMLLPVAALADGFWALPAPSLSAVLAVLGLAALSTALAYVVFFRISAAAGPTNVMLVTLLIPVSATVLGTLVLHESLAPHQVAGALVIASGLLVIDGRPLAWITRRPARS